MPNIITKYLNVLALALLAFNAIGAIYGGISLIRFPDGSGLQMSSALLNGSPFKSYLIPGIVLLTVNGIFCTYVFINTLVRSKHYPILIIAQGALLTGWIIIQMLIIQMVFFLHYIMGGTGILLLIIGFVLYKNRIEKF